jgi:hypothetical protein
MPAYVVAFRGARLTRNTRGALSAAGITPVMGYPREEREETGGEKSGWIPLTRKHAVSVHAPSAENAIDRVRSAVAVQGGYGEFTATLTD